MKTIAEQIIELEEKIKAFEDLRIDLLVEVSKVYYNDECTSRDKAILTDLRHRLET